MEALTGGGARDPALSRTARGWRGCGDGGNLARPSQRLRAVRGTGSVALPRPPRPGKTHGRWFAPNGYSVMLESGRGGEYYQAARRRAVELGLTHGRPNAEAAIARHVEIQFAERMREQGIMHAEIEINRQVCGTRPGKDDDLSDTCDKQLPRFLPPGSTLRVRDGTSGGRLYRGEEGKR
ncbi:DddA-like double-stranded DNA deaminase toxin [Saccharopolyspora sp. NPDC000995]